MTQLLSRKDAAARLGVTAQTIDVLRTTGKLTYIQRTPRAKVFISDVAIEEYLTRNTHRAWPDQSVRDTYRKRRI